ncbi:MAG: EamA family transporter [Chthonomonadales bacterium]
MQVILLILLATACVSVGETLFSAGMKQIDQAGASGFGLIGAAIKTPAAMGGLALMCTYFGLYAICLSKADISFVLPFTALSYLFVAIMAHFALKETVTPTRWAGAIIIVLGVCVVAFGERGKPH